MDSLLSSMAVNITFPKKKIIFKNKQKGNNTQSLNMDVFCFFVLCCQNNRIEKKTCLHTQKNSGEKKICKTNKILDLQSITNTQ